MDNRWSPDPLDWPLSRWKSWVKWQPDIAERYEQRWQARPSERAALEKWKKGVS